MRFPVSAYIVTGVKSDVCVEATKVYSTFSQASEVEWIRVKDEGLKGRMLHPSYVCYLCTDGRMGNIMTISWYSLVNEKGDFVMTVGKRRYTEGNLRARGKGRMAIVRKGDENKCRATGRRSGGRGDGVRFSQKVKELVKEGVVRVGRVEGGKMREINVEADDKPEGDWVVWDTDGFVCFECVKVVDEDEERTTWLCRIEECFVRKGIWDGKRFQGEGIVFKGGGEFS